MINRRTIVAASAAIGLSSLVAPQAAMAQHLHPVSHSVHRQQPAREWLDAILYAVKKINVAPPEAARYLAIGHMAGFAAMNGIINRYSDSLGVGRGPKGADPILAFHVAAEAALDHTMPGSFGGLKRNKLRAAPDGYAKEKALAWGRHVGDKIGKARAQDRAPYIKAHGEYVAFHAGSHPMKWRPTHGETNPKPILPGWGQVKPLGVRNIRRHRAPDFPDPRSPEFWRDVKLVRHVGGMHAQARDDDQDHIAYFWEDGPHSTTPPGHFMLIASDLFDGQMDALDHARALTLVAMAVADAGISAWDSKYRYDILRPETVISTGAAQGLPGFHQHGIPIDPRWRSFIPNPRFPAYVSGHSTFGAAGARMMQLVAGTDRINLRLTSPTDHLLPPHLQGRSRHFHSIWDIAQENGLSRIWGGVHWTFDHDEGMASGKSVAEEIHHRFFRPRYT